ncbi:nitrogenase component 1 [Phascolarctobacterium faecium]|uniref:nitrogenase component 1 n=1 Tax=Phascolarctobacterium faecium TaxID=33025 RepID=UPI003521AC83
MNVKVRKLVNYQRAASNLVVYPELGLASAEFLQEMLGQKYIIASLPYGMQNLLQWLKKIALSLDMQTDFTELKKDVSYNQEKFDTAIFQLR